MKENTISRVYWALDGGKDWIKLTEKRKDKSGLTYFALLTVLWLQILGLISPFSNLKEQPRDLPESFILWVCMVFMRSLNSLVEWNEILWFFSSGGSVKEVFN